jgi:uncharacterized protein
MHLDDEGVADVLDNLKRLGAVREVQGSGRVNKYRHAAYEWFGVNAPQAAVMTELLLRGPQTAGELRARASRMEPFASLDELTAVLDELITKSLVLPLTPPGRGQVFAHALYSHEELSKLRSLTHGGAEDTPAEPALQGGQHSPVATPASPTGIAVGKETFDQLLARLAGLEARVKRMEDELGMGGS